MIDKLKEVLDSLPQLLMDNEVHTMYIDYHKPFVSRIWFQHGDMRVFIHKIEPCDDSSEALYHPHKWDSAMYISNGMYEMGIGHSETNEPPKHTDCKILLSKGTFYEMTAKDGWHYVNPIDNPCYTVMVTGNLNGREMPIEPNKPFRTLTQEEVLNILSQIPQLETVDKVILTKQIISNE